MKNSYSFCFVAILLALLNSYTAFSQSPGIIVRPANGGTVTALNPNGNAYSSATTSGFTTDDIAQSEIPYKVVPPAITEPTGDLSTGPSAGFTDIVKTVDKSGFYVYSDGTNIFFRLRIGSIISGSKGYSVLIDTDQKMGNSGPYADPDYVAPTNTSNGNPGFEYEVVFETNFQVEVFNVNGTGNPASVATYPLNTHSQISVALSTDNGTPDYFYDWYIPLSAIGSPTSIRMAATTVTSPGSALQGSRSDIYGIDDAGTTVADAWTSVINAQPVISITGSGIASVGATCTAAPTLNSPISVGSSVGVSGKWTSMDASKPSTATITLYRTSAGVTSVVTTTTVTAGNTWTITVPTINNNDVFYATAVAAGESECLHSASVTASSCSVPPAVPTISCASQKGISGGIPSGNTILLYKVSSGTANPTATPITTNISYPTSTTYAYQNNNCSGTGSPLAAGEAYLIKTVSASGCISGATLICIQGSGSVNTLPTNAISLTTPIYPFHSSITGSGATSGEVLRLFVNDNYVSAQTASGSSFTFSGLSLVAGDQIKIYSQGSSGCLSISSTFTVNCYNQPPVITTNSSGTLVAGATSMSGTAAPGAAVTLTRTAPTTATWTTTANASGAWSITGLSLVSGDAYSATATTSSCATASQASTASVVGATTMCPTITGSYTESNTTVTGSVTNTATGTLRLYLDNVLIGSSAIATTGTSTWTISSLTYPLYNGGVLKATFQEGAKAESTSCSTVTVSCTSPATPSVTPTSQTIYTGSTVTFNIGNVVANTWYAVMNSSGISYANSIYTSGTSSFSLTTNAFSTSGTYNLKISADKLSGCPSSSMAAVVTVNDIALPTHFVQVTAAHVSATENKINWKVTDETNVDYYQVERSTNCNYFESIGKVAYQLSTQNTNQYQFIDGSAPASDKTCYQIKQVDIGGKALYSTIVSISVPSEKTFQVWPNPAEDKVMIEYFSERKVVAEVSLFDLNGRKMMSKPMLLQVGSNAFALDQLKKLASGSYFIRINSGAEILFNKLIIK